MKCQIKKSWTSTRLVLGASQWADDSAAQDFCCMTTPTGNGRCMDQ